MSLTPKDIEAMLQAERANVVRPSAQLTNRVLQAINTSAAAPAALVAKKTVLQAIIGAAPLKWAAVVAALVGAAIAVRSTMTEAPGTAPAPAALPTVNAVKEAPLPPSVAPAPVELASPPTAPAPIDTLVPTPAQPRVMNRVPPKAKHEGEPPAVVAELAPAASELDLLEKARRSIQSGQGNQALPLLEEHAQRFPNSAYLEERDSLAIMGLFQAQRAHEAQARADIFLRAFPRSIHRASIEQALSDSQRTPALTDFPGPRK